MRQMRQIPQGAMPEPEGIQNRLHVAWRATTVCAPAVREEYRHRWFTRVRQQIPAQKKVPPASAPSSAAVPSIAGSSRRQFPRLLRSGWLRPPFPDAGEMPPGSWTLPSAFFLPEPVPRTFSISAPAARCALPTSILNGVLQPSYLAAAWPEGIHETPDV